MRARHAAGGRTAVVIEFLQVGKTYRSLTGRTVRAVDGLSLNIERGEVVGLAGPNGAGKSTLIALLLGYLRPTDGEVRIDGLSPRRFIERRGIGYLSEMVAINPRWRADHALSRYAVLAGLPERQIPSRIDELVERLGLDEHRGKKIKALSKGTLQRLGLAQALLRDETVLVLDEPTHGLDPVWTGRFRDLVAALRHRERAVLLASHNLDELQRVADRVAIIDRGRIQRVVDVHAGNGHPRPMRYRLAAATGAEHVAEVFPGATSLGRGQFALPAIDLSQLNRGLAALLERGTMLLSITPAHSALEQQFREVVGGEDEVP